MRAGEFRDLSLLEQFSSEEPAAHSRPVGDLLQGGRALTNAAPILILNIR